MRLSPSFVSILCHYLLSFVSVLCRLSSVCCTLLGSCRRGLGIRQMTPPHHGVCEGVECVWVSGWVSESVYVNSTICSAQRE